MITLDLVELDLASLIKSLKTDEVLFIELRLLEGLDLAVLVKTLEPGSLLWIDHGVLSEHAE